MISVLGPFLSSVQRLKTQQLANIAPASLASPWCSRSHAAPEKKKSATIPQCTSVKGLMVLFGGVARLSQTQRLLMAQSRPYQCTLGPNKGIIFIYLESIGTGFSSIAVQLLSTIQTMGSSYGPRIWTPIHT